MEANTFKKVQNMQIFEICSFLSLIVGTHMLNAVFPQPVRVFTANFSNSLLFVEDGNVAYRNSIRMNLLRFDAT